MLKLLFSIQPEIQFITKIVCRNLSNEKYRKSFQYRILDYFENILKNHRKFQQYEVSTQIRDAIPGASNVKQNLESLNELIHNLSKETNRQTRIKHIHTFDIKCLTIINSLRQSEILNLLSVFLKVIPNGLTETDFYNKSISLLLEAAESGLLSNHEIVQLLFFISLTKEKGAVYLNYLKPYLPDMSDLSLTEKCITAQAFYKSSLKLESSQSKILEETIEKESKQLIADPLLLVSLCKIVRISGPSDKFVLKNLSEAIIQWNKTFSFVTTVHVLSLYAEALLFEPKVVHQLVNDSIEIIRKDSVKCQLRLKDVDRFLWSMGYLGLTLSLNKKTILRIYLEQRLEEYKIKENLGFLVNSILYLHILQCWNTKVINTCLQEDVFQPVFYEKFHWKVRSRLQLLISQINLEMEMRVPQALKKQIKIQYTPSKSVNSVAEVGITLVNKGIIKGAILECPVRTLQIPGVTLISEKNTYHVDILNNSTCLKDTNIPHGLMKLKLRLLPRMRYRQILIDRDTFKEDPVKTQTEIETQIVNSITCGRPVMKKLQPGL